MDANGMEDVVEVVVAHDRHLVSATEKPNPVRTRPEGIAFDEVPAGRAELVLDAIRESSGAAAGLAATLALAAMLAFQHHVLWCRLTAFNTE